MSKAFTREDDDRPERITLRKPSTNVPPGVKNYWTPDGLARLRAEMETLAAVPETPEIRQRKFEIEHIFTNAVAAPVPPQPWDQVLFGADVTVRDQTGEETTYRFVGADEMDLDKNWISWLSPLAKALLKTKLGQMVQFKSPAGVQQLEILAIQY